jgi:glycosyltransferase involved in cell wall biosynthesis
MARILVVRQYYFPHDTRVRREVDALASAGHEVDVLCMRGPGERRRERRGAVRIHRLPLSHRRAGPARYLWEYAAFMALAAVAATLLCARRRYDVVQVNTLPDSLVFAAIGPRLMGARVLLDLHECMPEFFGTKFGAGSGHPAVRLLAALERAAIRFSSFAITCTAQMRATFVARGAPRDRLAVILNSADEAIFDPESHPPRGREPGRFELICHGSIEEHYGLDTAIRAVALLRDELPELRLRVYGEGSQRDDLVRLATELDLNGAVSFSDGFVPLPQLLDAIAESDGGVVAMKRDAFRDLTHCNKMFDLVSMRRPVICSRTAAVEDYFGDDCFAYFRADDPADLARAIRELAADPRHADEMVRRAEERNEPYRWARQRERYLRVVEALAARPPERAALAALADD